MSGYHTSDQEQIQMLKDWWRKYGTTVLVGLMVFFLVNFSWSFWRNYQQRYNDEASLMYTQLLSKTQLKQDDAVRTLSDHLLKDYNRTPYASLTALLLAKNAVGQKKMDVALTQLQWVIDNSSSDSLKQMARIRAARILFANNKKQEALDILQRVDDDGYMAPVLELRGDILLSQGKKDEAAAAYRDALKSIPEEATPPLLKMKLERLS